MKSKGWFGAAAIAVVVVGVSCLFFAQEFTGSKREAAVARIRELSDTYHVAPAVTPPPGVNNEATVPKDAGNVDGRSLFLRIAGMERALRESNPSGWRACEMMRGQRYAATSEMQTETAAYLSQADELIRETRRLAAMTGPYFTLDYSKGRLMDRSALETLMCLGRLLCVDACVQLPMNDPLAPVADLVAVMRLANETPRDPYLVTVGCYHWLYQSALLAAQNVVTATSVSADQLRLLEAQIPRDAERDLYRRAIIGDTTMTLDALIAPLPTLPLGKGNIRIRFVTWLENGPLGAPLKNQAAANYADSMVRAVDAAGLPYYEAKPRLDALDASKTQWSKLSTGKGFESDMLSNQADYEACLDILRMGLFLQRYYQEHGEYPATLDAIGERMGGQVPVDPYSGEQYFYRPSDNTFLLRSVGKLGRKDVVASNDVVWDGSA